MKDKADNSLDATPRAPTNRREGLKLGAAGLMTSLLPMPSLLAAQAESPPKEKAMADNKAIRPFHFEASQADLADLRRRVSATKWPEQEQVSDATQGVQLATVQKLAEYWATQHDWRKCEARLNALPMFITGIDRCHSRARASLRNRHPRPFHHGIRRRGGAIFWSALPSDERQVQADMRTHLIHRPARDIIPPLGGVRLSSYRV
jgi:Epoxide hydrolase N terminus